MGSISSSMEAIEDQQVNPDLYDEEIVFSRETDPLTEWYSKFQHDNPEQFNKDFIFSRANDDLVDYLSDISKALEVVDGIKFLGCEIIEDESKFDEHFDTPRTKLSIAESRLILAVLRFRVTHKDQTEDIDLPLFFPKLVDDFFYIMNGNKYYAIYQLVDRGTYSTGKTFSLKTLLMPIVFRTDKHSSIEDIDGATISSRLMILDIFKNKRNVLFYYMPKFGVDGVIEYFGMDEDIAVVDCPLDELNEDYPGDEFHRFQVGSAKQNYYVVARKSFLTTDHRRSFLVSLVDVLFNQVGRGGLPVDLNDSEYWMRRLGKFYTKNTNAQLDKAQKVLISLERILDLRTRKNLVHVAEEDKTDVYAILRWMLSNYETLSREDNMDLNNKRIRLSEYIIHALLIKFSDATYRMLNARNQTFAGLRSIFRNIRPNFITKRLTTNKLLRYNNAVNAIDLFACALKWSQRGPQSMADGSKTDIHIRYRGLHPSYVGKIGLTAASSSDPGMSGTFSPFIETDGFFFDTQRKE